MLSGIFVPCAGMLWSTLCCYCMTHVFYASVVPHVQSFARVLFALALYMQRVANWPRSHSKANLDLIDRFYSERSMRERSARCVVNHLAFDFVGSGMSLQTSLQLCVHVTFLNRACTSYFQCIVSSVFTSFFKLSLLIVLSMRCFNCVHVTCLNLAC